MGHMKRFREEIEFNLRSNGPYCCYCLQMKADRLSCCEENHFVDFDDCLTGPVIQDLWMLLSGTTHERVQQLRDLLTGYSQFLEFDFSELALIEVLRGLRLMHYAAWLARRWHDPAFPQAFPWFDQPKFWEQHVLDLREQLSAIEESPLSI